MRTIPLPPTAQEVADIIGREATLALARKVKHRCLYVPKHMPPDYWIRREIGDELANKLQKIFAGEQVPLAKCKSIACEQRRIGIEAAFHEGKSVQEIALMFGLSTQHLYQNLRIRYLD